MGRLVRLNEALPIERAVELVKEHLKLKNVRLAASDTGRNVQTIGICAGSGASLLKNVKADLLLTGEMSHHEVLDVVHKGTHVILCEHSNTERGFLLKWKQTLQAALGDGVQITVSIVDRDPLKIV
jgi:putative NIF3 family GTP cyclohydrolase 1 type 2